MDFVDAFVGYAAGEVNDTSSVIKTTDGGASWIDKSSGFPERMATVLLLNLLMLIQDLLVVVTYLFYKTTDGGDTWG